MLEIHLTDHSILKFPCTDKDDAENKIREIWMCNPYAMLNDVITNEFTMIVVSQIVWVRFIKN